MDNSLLGRNMIFRTEAGTDIAMLGIWDTEVPADDIGKQGHKAFLAALEADSGEGKLVYINTFEDGGYSIWLVTDEEELPEDLADWYTPIDRSLYLNTPSGRLTVGGLEDYRSTKPKITSEKDIFEIGPGIYKLSAHQLYDDEEQSMEEVRKRVGDKEYEYYQSRSTGCLAAFSLVVSGLIVSPLYSWAALPMAIVAGIVYVMYRFRVNSRDERYLAVQKAFDDWNATHPCLICQLEKVTEMQPSDGCFDLNSVPLTRLENFPLET